MKPSDRKDLEQWAILAELARPLVHETNNFLNTFLLQLAISENAFPEPLRADWGNLRREGKKLANLFQQWQHYRKPSAQGPRKTELNQLMRETIEDLRSDAGAIDLVLRQASEPLWLEGFPGEGQRLCYVLLRYAIAAVADGQVADPVIEIQLEKSHARIILRFVDAGPANANLLWADFNDRPLTDRHKLSLPALACQSLVERLQGSIRVEKHANGRLSLTVDLPFTLS